MKIYLVGGAVRDTLLGITPKERDWLVVGGSADEMLAMGFRRADAEFPVFLHPDTGEEYALARTEIKSGSGYKGFEVDAGPHITLEQDLVRRDFTINAMVQDEDGNLIDAFGGRNDLAHRRLRHISPAFVEDPLRVLRAARFAARLDFSVATETMALLKQMASSGELATIKRERLGQELLDAIGGKAPWAFFEVLQECGALQALNLHIPDLPQTLTCLRRAVARTDSSVVRVAVVLYPTAVGAGVASLEEAIRLPADYTRLLELLISHAAEMEPVAHADADSILSLITELRAEQQPGRFAEFIQAATALWPDLMERAGPNLVRALDAIGSVSAADLKQKGLGGKELGAELQRLRLAEIRAELGC